MIELLLALAGQPAAVQDAPVSPLAVVDTFFVVSSTSPSSFRGDIRVVVENTGPQPDELVAVSTPLGDTLEFRTDGSMFSRQAPVALPIALPPPSEGQRSYLPLVVRVPGLETGDYRSTGTTITLRFALAGEMTLAIPQGSPAP